MGGCANISVLHGTVGMGIIKHLVLKPEKTPSNSRGI